MSDAVVVSTARTGLAKSWRGSLNMSHPVTYAGHVLRHAIERARIDAGEVEDVLVGATFLEGAAGANVGRQVGLRAGCHASGRYPLAKPRIALTMFARPTASA